jgi:uncharacterized membrane protein YraQ (UPF0718 family)
MHSLRIFLGEDPIFVFYLPEKILRMAIGYHVNYLLLELFLAYEFLVCSFAINFILYSALHTALNKWV